MIALTETELRTIRETLEDIKDESDALIDYCDTTFNSGALEGIENSLEIINALQSQVDKQKLQEIEEENEDTLINS